VQPVKSGQSTNYKPTFAIVNWIDRPAPLGRLYAPVVAAPAIRAVNRLDCGASSCTAAGRDGWR
jgi:hypothetical protein